MCGICDDCRSESPPVQVQVAPQPTAREGPVHQPQDQITRADRRMQLMSDVLMALVMGVVAALSALVLARVLP
jgi:hypothetical protein